MALLDTAAKTVRKLDTATRIIMHFAGLEGSDWFFNLISKVDYDDIGLSYYPIWHGKDLQKVKSVINLLGSEYHKKVLIAETAYPFTMKSHDQTNNIVGLDSQIILPNYPASPKGQLAFMERIRSIVEKSEYGLGFCYWGGELVAYKGTSAMDGSPWENQALYDFSIHALPILKVFSINN